MHNHRPCVKKSWWVVSGQKVRTGQQRQAIKASTIAGGVGHRIDKYPNKAKRNSKKKYRRD